VVRDLRSRLAEAETNWKYVDEQTRRLASFIMAECPGEPSQDQGACDTAIRITRGLLAENARLRGRLQAECERRVQADDGCGGNYIYRNSAMCYDCWIRAALSPAPEPEKPKEAGRV
jgi:hypothetical protein